MLNGFLLTLGDRELFLISNGKNVTKGIIDKFIEEIGRVNNKSPEIITQSKENENVIKRTRFLISRATLEKIDTGKVIYYSIKGKDFLINIPESESDCLIIFK